MSNTWYLVLFIVGAVYLIRQKEFENAVAYTELQLKRLRLFLYMYPGYLSLKFRMRFMLWRLRYNTKVSNNQDKQTK